jgi:AraC-like DNA-binding protein
MRFPEALNGSHASTALDTRSGATSATNIVDDEPEWRSLSPDSAVASSNPRIIARRWHAVTEQTREFSAITADDYHVVKIVLRRANIRLSVARRTVQDGVATPGMFHITEPAAVARCLFRGSYDVLHLHVPNVVIAECARDMLGREVAALCSQANPVTDPTMDLLGRALLRANQLGDSSARLCVDYINMAIVAVLLDSVLGAASFRRPKVSKLARWRLERVMGYVDARLAEPVSLADIASVTGLAPMHFAAQFKATTGLRPHEYLLRRRVERAQDMFAKFGSTSVVDVALSVGFQTQAHFTTVFKRFVGQPPSAWRQSIANKSSAK